MAVKRFALLGLVLAAAGVAAIAWWRHDRGGRHDRAGQAGPGPGSLIAPAPPRLPVGPTTPVGPVAPSPPVRIVPPEGAEPPSAPGSGLGFDDEPRDPTWADEHERELALRLRTVEQGLAARGVAVQIGPPECRRSLCRLSIAAADSAALGKLYGVLESEDGLYGWADTMLLERVVTAGDGRVETGIIAQFVRDLP